MLLVSFASEEFRRALGRLHRSALAHHVQQQRLWGKQDFLRTDFARRHSEIASQRRGCGFWLWKPYYIAQALSESPPGSVVMYCDASQVFAQNPRPLLDYLSPGTDVLLFRNFQGSLFICRSPLRATEHNLYVEINKNRYWAKRACIEKMGLTEAAFDSPQVDASAMVFRVSSYSRQFVHEWLRYCTDSELLTDTPADPRAELVLHTHDQAIVSLLAHRESVPLFRCASQFGNHYKIPKLRASGEFKILPYAASPEPAEYGTILTHDRFAQERFLRRLRGFVVNEMKTADELWFGSRAQRGLRTLRQRWRDWWGADPRSRS